MLIDVSTLNYKADSDGLLALYDSGRNVWLSVGRVEYAFSTHHVAVSAPRWLSVAGGITSNNSGYSLPRDAVITALTVQAQAVGSAGLQIQVKRSGSVVAIGSAYTLISEREKTWTGLNHSIQEEDALMLKMTSGTLAYPVVTVELAWKVTL